jgi:hypothetical protein
MPTTIAEAFAASALTRQGVVGWGTKPPTSKSGVYVVSLTQSLDLFGGTFPEAPLAGHVFDRWLEARPELALDGARPTVHRLMDRVRGFWISDEVILYIGLATSLSNRLADYYRTPIGSRSPHAGGYFLKLLSNLDQLWVHYAESLDFKAAEGRMLRRFCEHVSSDSRRALLDPIHPFPFANLEWPRGTRKRHGIGGAREPKRKTSSAGE